MSHMSELSNAFGVTTVQRQEEGEDKISSTRIRKLLQQGDTDGS